MNGLRKYIYVCVCVCVCMEYYMNIIYIHYMNIYIILYSYYLNMRMEYYSAFKKGDPAICNGMDEPGRQYTK